jgi:hypothetical protein
MHYNDQWVFRICLRVLCIVEAVVSKHWEEILNIFEFSISDCHVIFRAKDLKFPASSTSQLAQAY